MRFLMIILMSFVIGTSSFAGTLPNIIHVKSSGEGDWYQQGTGFFIDGQGDLVTAQHVVDGANPKKITIIYNNTHYLATIKAQDSNYDVAILHINATDTPYFKITDPIDHEVATILGFPAVDHFGQYVHVTQGEVALDNVTFDSYSIFGKACHGNSGGPVINNSGDVIGVLVWGFDDYGMLSEDQLCSFHSGARFTTHMLEMAKQLNLPISYSKLPSNSVLSGLDLMSSIIYQSKVVVIFAQVDSKDSGE